MNIFNTSFGQAIHTRHVYRATVFVFCVLKLANVLLCAKIKILGGTQFLINIFLEIKLLNPVKQTSN